MGVSYINCILLNVVIKLPFNMSDAAHSSNQQVIYATPLRDEVKCCQRIPAEF
jgi:hypothetical protein